MRGKCGTPVNYSSVPYFPARAVSARATSSITALGARSRMVSSAVKSWSWSSSETLLEYLLVRVPARSACKEPDFLYSFQAQPQMNSSRSVRCRRASLWTASSMSCNCCRGILKLMGTFNSRLDFSFGTPTMLRPALFLDKNYIVYVAYVVYAFTTYGCFRFAQAEDQGSPHGSPDCRRAFQRREAFLNCAQESRQEASPTSRTPTKEHEECYRKVECFRERNISGAL